MRSSSSGTSGFTETIGGGVRLRIASNTTAAVGPANACRPVAISCSTTPSENRSDLRVQILAARLLGRHVGHGADGHPDCRQNLSRDGLRRRVQGRRARVTGRELGQPEVEHLGVPALGDEDVGGLDVAVQDALRCAPAQSRR